jgi:hypothetical protein
MRMHPLSTDRGQLLAVGCLTLAAMGAQRAGAEVNAEAVAVEVGAAEAEYGSPRLQPLPMPRHSLAAPLDAAFARGVRQSAFPRPASLPLQLLGTNDRLELVPFELTARRVEKTWTSWRGFAPAAIRASGETPVVPDPRLVGLLKIPRSSATSPS